MNLPTDVAAAGSLAHVSLPGVPRVAALLKRWLLGTRQGGVEANHLAAYLDEYVFRFNRRRSEQPCQLRRALSAARRQSGEEAHKAHRANLAAGAAQPGPQPSVSTSADTLT